MLSRRSALRFGALGGALATLAGCSPAARYMLTEGNPADLDEPGADPRILRLMNRAGFGPRRGELDRAQAMGFEAYLEEQLHPEDIEDRACSLLVRNLHLYHREYGRLHFADWEDIERELVRSTLMRAVTSRRQLYEAMVEFWSDHFTIFALKEPHLSRYKLIDDREVIRPHAMGHFGSLLHASATSPAMLIYLDNVSNYADAPNENYARELMELHTLGIDGGYTQHDVQELARALTGWTVHLEGFKEGRFFFNEDAHDPTEKTVIGHTIPAGSGEAGIRRMLNVLVLHPSTAHFISTKLVRRFIADDSPADAVAEVARTFMQTQGDMRAVLRTLFRSEAFAAAPPKIKRPMTFVASMLRAFDADISPTGYRTLYDALTAMGHKPFGWPMPDGYPDTTNAWLGSLLPRWNFALRAVSGSLDGISMRFDSLVEAASADPLRAITGYLLGSPLSPDIRTALETFLANEGSAEAVAALLLASPDFQWS